MNAPGSTNRAVTTPANGAVMRANCSSVWVRCSLALAISALAAEVVHGLRHDEVGRLSARLSHPLVVAALHVGFGLVLRLVREQFGHLDLGEQLPFG